MAAQKSTALCRAAPGPTFFRKGDEHECPRPRRRRDGADHRAEPAQAATPIASASAARTQAGPSRRHLSCGNLAHGFAACAASDKPHLAGDMVPNLAIVTAYNDMLSAHQPYERFPDADPRSGARGGRRRRRWRAACRRCATASRRARPGMELSLFSRDVIALSTGVALSHDMFDAAVYLGICDKIVPGLLIGALAFGHLPAVFVPAGPMPSGMPNDEKSRDPPALRRGQGRRARSCSKRNRSPTTRPAPAPSTAPPTPTRC